MTYSVTTADVESRWRTLSDAEADVATTLIGDAEAMLDTYRAGLASAVADGRVSRRIVVMTIAEAVIRVMMNPDRVAQQSVTADGGVSIGYQFEQTKPAPRLRLTDLDLAAVDKAMNNAGIRTGKTSSLKMSASTRWGLLHGGQDEYDSEDSGILAFPGLSDICRASDSISIVLQ